MEMIWLMVNTLLIYQCSCALEAPKSRTLVVGGIFPMTSGSGWAGGLGCLPAARMALEDVNNRSDILPYHTLSMTEANSKCLPGLGTKVMYDLLYTPPAKIMLLTGCSPVSTTVAEAAKMWNLIVLSYGSSSPALSNRERFPTFFRTHPSQTLHNPTRVAFFREFNWTRIHIIQEVQELFLTTVQDLEQRLKAAKMEIGTRQSFLSDPTDAVRNLRRQDARIIVGLFYDAYAPRIFCEAYKNGLYGKKHVWFIVGWYADNWYTKLDDPAINCTIDQIKQAIEGHFTTEALMLSRNLTAKTISGMSALEFQQALEDRIKKKRDDVPGFPEAPLAYDAIWSLALALNKTQARLEMSGQSLENNFSYNRVDIMKEIYQNMNEMEFSGVSGRVAFSRAGDRIAQTQVEQMINGTYRKIAFFDVSDLSGKLDWINGKEAIKWKGGKPPPDRTVIREEIQQISPELFLIMCIVASIGILFALTCLIFNLIYRNAKSIQMSGPSLNNISMLGIMCCLFSIILLGFDDRLVDPHGFRQICHVRAWLLTLGFTLAYGAMFAKVWTVHRLATKAKKEAKNSGGWNLYVIIIILLTIDLTILVIWEILDPLERNMMEFPLQDPTNSDDDKKIQPLLEHCESKNHIIWLGVMYGYKGLVLVFGIFLAYETRSMKIKQLNDSRFVGMSIYNVVVLCLITSPVTIIIGDQQDASFIFVSLAIIFCSFLTMALIFVPKFMSMWRYPRDSAESTALTDNCPSKEEEERLQKLTTENEEIKKDIAEKEEQIKELHSKLQDRSRLRAALTAKHGGSLPTTITTPATPLPPIESDDETYQNTTKAEIEPSSVKESVEYTFTIDCDDDCPMATPESSFINDPNSDSGVHSVSNAKSSKGSATTGSDGAVLL